MRIKDGRNGNLSRKTELLAPAGSYEILKAVIHAGADAVYAAGTRFGARAYAQNFSEEEMLAAIDYVHLKGKRLYLTVNTLLKDEEMQELYAYLAPLYEAGLDAVIVQDIGVMHFVRKHFPDLPIHASTQMTVTGAYGAGLLLDQGCSRIVTARELSLEEISNIYRKTGAEIESFVHGALCYSYSGQCLLSSMIGGRSGNRGRCAQPCRLSYGVLVEKESLGKHSQENYPLSLKDLCTIEMIPRLVESGIYSFKIEGRMKQARYAAGVTAIYRKYLDIYERDPSRPYQVSGEDYQTLLDLGNRSGFTDGYYRRRNGREMITFHKPSHEKNMGNSQSEDEKKEIGNDSKEKIKGILRLSINNPASLVLEYNGVQAETTGDLVQRAEKQPLSEETVREKIKKTGNTPFQFESLQISMDADSFLPVGALNQLRRKAVENLSGAVLGKYRRTLQESAGVLDGEGREDNFGNIFQENAEPGKQTAGQSKDQALHLSVLTETLEQFETTLQQPEAERIYLETFALGRKRLCRELKDFAGRAHQAGKECYLALPHVFRMETVQWYERNWKQITDAGMDGYLVRNLEELSFLKEMGVPGSMMQGDYHLYAYSNEAVCGWRRLSLHRYTIPVELNRKELGALDCTGGEMIIYGYQPVMLSAQCLHKNTGGCDKTEGVCYLKDRYGNHFPVKNHCEDCYNVLYNICPLALFHQFRQIQALHPGSVRLSFTVESGREAARIFDCYRQALAGRPDRDSYEGAFTNGHFKRGVE